VTPRAGEITVWEWAPPPSAPEKPLSFERLSAKFKAAIEAQVARLRPGLERGLAWLLVEAKLAAADGPEIALDLERLRRQLRVRPERFADLWQRVRAILPLRFSSGRVAWPDVDNGRRWSEARSVQNSAKGVLGNAVKRLHRVIERARADEAWFEGFAAALRKLRFAQQHAREAGMKVANDLAEVSLARAAELLAGKGAWRTAYQRLKLVAAAIGASMERVEQIWRDMRARRDLVLRHAYGCLHFNAMREALLGTLRVWEWPELLDDPGRLAQRCGVDPPPAAA